MCHGLELCGNCCSSVNPGHIYFTMSGCVASCLFLLQPAVGHWLQARDQSQSTLTAYKKTTLLAKQPMLFPAELAAAVGKAFLLRISSDSVQKTVTANPDKFSVSQKAGIIATEEILEQIEKHNVTLGV